ncbi:MAG: hypothetical protein ABI222_06325 [Opitutaceae bacterium]
MRNGILADWRSRWLERVGQLVNLLGVVIALVWMLPLLQTHIRVIAQPGPQEYNEPAIWHTTWLLDHGRNPYTAKELPGAAYCFDPLYNYMVLAFKPLLGIDYTAHRLINLVFLLGTLALVVRLMVKAGAGCGIALLTAVFYYWMSLKNIEITARPDLPGLFFFLLGLLVPWERNYTRGSTVFGLGCALVAFHFKFYFVLAGCATLMGYFLVRAKWEACWLGVGFFGLVGLSFAACCHYFPYFYIETVLIQQAATVLNSHDDVSITHTLMLFGRAWPYLLLLLYGLGRWIWRRQVARRSGQPVDRPEDMRFLSLSAVFVIYLVIVYFYMGRNAGAYFTYHLHLLFPLMFVLAAYAITRPWIKILFGLLLAIFVMSWLTVLPVPDSAEAYRRMEHLVSTARGEVLGIASTTDIFERQGRRVLHNGNTMFIGFAFGNNGIARDPMIAVLGANSDATIAEVNQKVANRQYAMVLTEFDNPYFCSAELLRKNYLKEEQIDYFTYFGHSPVRVWRPKPREPEATHP